MFHEFRFDWVKLTRNLAYDIPTFVTQTWEAALSDSEESWLDEADSRFPMFSTWVMEVFARIYDTPSPVDASQILPEARWAVRLHAFLDAHGFVEQTLEWRGSVQKARDVALMIGRACFSVMPQVKPQETRTAAEVMQDLVHQVVALRQLRDQSTDPMQVRQLEADIAAIENRIRELESMGVAPCAPHIEVVEAICEQLVDRYMPSAVQLLSDLKDLELAWLGVGFPYDLGFGQRGILRRSPSAAERERFAKLIATRPDFIQFAALIGRAVNSAAMERSKKILEGRDFLDGIRRGDDLSRITSEEMLRAVTPGFDRLFDRDFVEGRLQISDQLTHDGSGAMIILLDVSGSMMFKINDRFTQQDFAMAMAIALLIIADNENRPAFLIGFDDTIRFEFSFPDGITSADILDLIELEYLQGSTNFKGAIERGIKALSDSGFENAHLLMITDGEDTLQDSWIDATRTQLEALNSKLHVLLIGSYPAPPFEGLAERIIQVPDLADPSTTELYSF